MDSYRKILTIGIAALLLFSVPLSLVGNVSASHGTDNNWSPGAESDYTYVVDPNDSTADYQSLDTAISNVAAGESIYVRSATYTPSTMTVTVDNVTIHAEDGATIDGSDSSDIHIVEVAAGGSDIRGFTMTNISAGNSFYYSVGSTTHELHEIEFMSTDTSNFISGSSGQTGITVNAERIWFSTADETTISNYIYDGGGSHTITWKPYYLTGDMLTRSDQGGAHISGIVDSSGNSITGVDVTVKDSSGTIVHQESSVSAPERINLGSADDYTVTVNHPDYEPTTTTYSVSVGAIQSNSYTLNTATGTMEVASVEDADGNAIDTFDVVIYDAADGSVVQEYSGVSAPFTSELEIGDYNVEVKASGYESSTTAYTITENTTTSNSYTLTEATGTIEVSDVVDSDSGESLSSFNVTITDSNGNVVKEVSDVSAPYTYELRVGDYNVEVNSDGYSSSSKTLIVESNQTISSSFSVDLASTEQTETGGGTGSPVDGIPTEVLVGGAIFALVILGFVAVRE